MKTLLCKIYLPLMGFLVLGLLASLIAAAIGFELACKLVPIISCVLMAFSAGGMIVSIVLRASTDSQARP